MLKKHVSDKEEVDRIFQHFKPLLDAQAQCYNFLYDTDEENGVNSTHYDMDAKELPSDSEGNNVNNRTEIITHKRERSESALSKSYI